MTLGDSLTRMIYAVMVGTAADLPDDDEARYQTAMAMARRSAELAEAFYRARPWRRDDTEGDK